MGKEWKNPNFFKALKNSVNGIFYSFKNEKNIKIQLCFAIFAIIMSVLLKISYIECTIITITIFFVLFAEFINTSIEKTIDMYTEEYNEKAKIAKDIAAGAVLLSAICSVIVGIFVFLPKLLEIF